MWKASLMRYETTLVVRFKRQHLYKFSCYRPIGYMCKSYGWLVCYSGKWLGELCTVCQMVGLVHAVNVKKNGREKCFVDLSQAVAITVDVSCCSVWLSWFENCQFLFRVKDIHHITFNVIFDSSCFFWKNRISLQDCYWLENVSVALFLSYHHFLNDSVINIIDPLSMIERSYTT